MSVAERSILMAVVGAAHGIQGAVKVRSFTADPLDLGAYGPLHAADGRVFEVKDVRPIGQSVVVKLRGVADRNAAEALNGTELFVDRSALPEEADEETFYHADLVGLSVRDETGAAMGTIRAVHDFGAGDILELQLSDASVYIPFTRDAVPEVDLTAGFVRVDPVAAGLVAGDDEIPPGEDLRESVGRRVGKSRTRARGSRP